MSRLQKDSTIPSVASMSQEDQESRTLKVTLLSSEWRSSTDGDLSTINRELAIQLAKHPHVDVSILLPNCSREDRTSAESHNVKLIEADKTPGVEPFLCLLYPPINHTMHCVIGHGVQLGRLVPFIKRNPNYSHCKWIQVVHSAPEEDGMYKNISEREKRQKTEIQLCKMADQVITIGPKLAETYKRYLCSVKQEEKVFDLTPSIFSEFLELRQATEERRKFCILVIGSGDSCEDFNVKGYDIAAKAIAELKDESYKLKFVCPAGGKGGIVAEKLLQHGISRNQLIVCSFDDSRKVLADLFCEVDLAIMPSRTEGFGTTALEALSAGLPVLVSGNSGLGEALKKVPLGSQSVVDSEDPKDWAKEIKCVHQKEREVRLSESSLLREKYLEKYCWEEPCKSLVIKMRNLVFGGSEQVFRSLQQWQQNAGSCKISSNTDLLLDFKKKGYRISDSPESGNCMFYALSEQLEIVKRVKIHHSELRQTLVQYLREHPKLVDGTDLFHFVDRHTTWDGYLRDMEQDGSWGDHVILWAAANCYEIAIHVISSLPGQCEVIIQSAFPFDQRQHLVLGHVHEVHYVSLQPLQDGELNITVDAEEWKLKETNMQTTARAVSPTEGSASYSGTGDSLAQTVLCSIALNYLKTIPPQSREEHNIFKEYLREIKVIIKDVSEGSLVITVKCESLQSLEKLWTDYSSGHLGEMVQNCFVTEKILKEHNLTELRLKTTMDREEYNATKVYFERVALREPLKQNMDFSETQEREENHFVQDEDEIDIKCLLKEGEPTEGDIDWIVREISSNPDEKKKLFELLRVNDDDPGYNSGDSIDNAKDFTDGMTIPRHLLKNQTYEELAALLGESPLNRRDLAVKTCCIQKDLLPTYILARGNQAVTAYRGALTSGETLDNRVKVILIGEGQVGKTSVAKALRGEKFEENERSVNGILMSEVIKNATHDKAWRNSANRENARPVSSQTNGIDAIESISLEDEVDGARSNSPEIELVVWELSGQGAYRAIHPMFMTPDAVYVLVFDLSKGLFDQATAKDNENGSATNSENEDSNLDCIMRWMDILNSMRYSAADEILPPVLLVGTHADCVNGNPRSIMDALLDRFRKIELGDQIKGNFVLDNTLNVPGQEDPQVAKLRRRILDEANKLPHAMKKIPRKWFDIERKIQKEAKEGIKYYTTKEVLTKKVCQTQDLNEIDQILLFLCDRRSIIYHENASKQDGLVVLDPQWLVGRLCKLLSLPPEEEDKIEFRNLRKELRETGILHQKLLHRTCTEWEVKDIEEALVSLMKHYNLLFHCPRKEKNPIYLVPCMIKRATGENEVIPSKNGSSTSPPIYLIFGTKFVPIGLFSRLAMLIGAWAAKKSSFEQLQINADTACFILDGVNFLELKCFKSVIQVQVWSEDSTRQYSDPGLYSEIYCCLERSLKAVCATCHWLHSVSWDLSVQCRLCAGMVNLKTRKCIWHDKRNCHHEDCAHYIPLKRHIALFCQQAMKRLPEEKFERWVQASGKNNSQEETGKENIASTNEITVLLLAEEWGSGKGGLSTINRQLAIELARYSNLRIYFYVIKSNEEDKQMAKSSNINIIKAKKRPGYNNGFERLSFPPEELPLIDVVVGHGVKLGKQAQLIKVKHPRCVWVQFEHTAPEELGTYKNYEGKIARGESKHRDEVDLAKRADVVAAIGPKLTEYYKTSLRPDKGGPEKVFEMIPDPSMFHEFRSCKQVKEDRENFNVLIFGRGDSEDFKLKGFDIAARAVAELNDEKYHLYAVGAPHGQQEDVEKKLLQCDISRRQLTVRGFIESRDEVAQLLCEVDLAIMPSRTEGFGLTALEALAAGLPILVGKNSGFAKALQKINESACIVNSEDRKEWANAIRLIKEKPRSERLQEAKRLKERCESEFAWSGRCQALREKILLLVEKKSHNKDMKGEQRCEVAAVPEGQEEDETQNQSQTTRRPNAVEEQEPTGCDEGYSSSKDRTNSTEFSSGHEETSNSPNAGLNVRRNFHADTEDTRLNEQQNGSQLERDENQETGTSQKNSTQGPRQRKNLPSHKDCDGEMTKEMTFSSIKDLQCWRTRSCLILVILAMLIVTALCFQR